jgi:hypothetical protein
MKSLLLVPVIAILTFSSVFATVSLTPAQSARVRTIDSQITRLTAQIERLKAEKVKIESGSGEVMRNMKSKDATWYKDETGKCRSNQKGYEGREIACEE